MCFVLSFMPATIFLVIGYFVLFSSNKAEGAIRRFGQVLAIWLFIIALFFPVGGAYVSISGQCPAGEVGTMEPN